MLVGLGVGIDANDLCRLTCQHAAAIALAAGHVDDLQPRDPVANPLVDDQVALVPVVLLWHVGQRALAGEGQRRDAVGLVALEVELGLGLVRHR